MAKLDKYKVIDGSLFSFDTDGTVQDGDAVTLVAPGTVGRGSAGDKPIGKALKVDGTKATVQMSGVLVFEYTSASVPGQGPAELVVTGGGKVVTASGGRSVYVLDNDSSAQEIAVLL